MLRATKTINEISCVMTVLISYFPHGGRRSTVAAAGKSPHVGHVLIATRQQTDGGQRHPPSRRDDYWWQTTERPRSRR